MPKIKILPNADLCSDGVEFEVEPGISLCDALLANHIDIEHACEKSCACTTCHVIMRKGYDNFEEATEDEDDLLDRAWGLEPESRLSCQTIMGNFDIEIEIPRYTVNHAKEDH